MRAVLKARFLCVLKVSALLMAAPHIGSKIDAQVFEVRGGESSLYQAKGGTLSISGSTYDLSLGAGFYAGHFESGARLHRRIGNADVIAGDDHLQFDLPTDVFDQGHYLYTRGVSATSKVAGADLTVFGGVDSTVFSNPLFMGGKMGQPLAFISLHRSIAPDWEIFSDTVLSSKQSQIVALQWKPHPQMRFALSGGIGSNQPYGAASVALTRSWLDLMASYVQAGKDFHRFVLDNPVVSEPEKGNALITIRPSKVVSFNGGVENYLVPVNSSGLNATSSSTQAGVALQFPRYSLSAELYDSKYQGQIDHAASAMLQFPVTRRVKVMSTYMASRPEHASGNTNVLTTISEIFNSRFSLNQSVSASGNTPTFYYGGSFDSNLFSISANYETFYIPARTGNPFENALMLDTTVRVLGRYRLHGQTNLSPTGHLLYSVDAYGTADRGAAASRSVGDDSIDRCMLRIQVVDTSGFPVQGAALMIDEKLVYSDSSGRLFIRERKPRSHKLAVSFDQFLSQDQWTIQSMPQVVESQWADRVSDAVVILRPKVGNGVAAGQAGDGSR